LQSEDIANAIVDAVTQPARGSVNEILIRPTQQPVCSGSRSEPRHQHFSTSASQLFVLAEMLTS
jgi:hypothetical protein